MAAEQKCIGAAGFVQLNFCGHHTAAACCAAAGRFGLGLACLPLLSWQRSPAFLRLWSYRGVVVEARTGSLNYPTQQPSSLCAARRR